MQSAINQQRARPLLLVTRNFPPQVGGLERYAEDLYLSLSERTGVHLLANSTGVRGIPLFLVRVCWHLLWHRRAYRHLHFADAALAPVACIARWWTGVPVTATAHALDVVYPNRIYQWLVPRCLRRLNGLVCVSRHTRSECVARGMPEGRCRVIPNGIREQALPGTAGTMPVTGIDVPISLDGKTVLLSICRLVKRKGLAWFVAEVMPRLPESHVLLVGGGGVEEGLLRDLVERLGLRSRIALLGYVGDEVKRALWRRADLFVMPNVKVQGDAEGFGIAALEAAANGIPVMAAELEGLTDAVIDGVTGRLLPSQAVDAWLAAIRDASFERESVRAAVLQRFAWNQLASVYLDYFDSLAAKEPGGH